MSEDGARLNIKVFRFGDAPHQARIEGRDIVDVIEKGEEFLSNVRRKYE
jgi:hypothetical protein